MIIYNNRDSVLHHVPIMISFSFFLFIDKLNKSFKIFELAYSPQIIALIFMLFVIFGVVLVKMVVNNILFKNNDLAQVIHLSKQVSILPALIYLLLSFITLFI